MKTNFNLFKILALAIVFAGCVAGDVGQEKSTAGGSGGSGSSGPTADPNITLPVPAAGSIILETAGLQAISATISNPSSKTFTVQWFINGVLKETEAVNDTAPAFNFNPLDVSVVLNAANNVTAEVRVSGTLVDSFVWTYTVNEVLPSFGAAAPALSPTTTSVNILDTSEIFTIAVNDPAAKTYLVRWYRNGVLQETDTFPTPVSRTENPNALGQGSYIITAELRNIANTVTHASVNWILSVDNPSITSEAPAVATPVDISNSENVNSTFSVTINPFATFDVVWRVNGGIVSTDNDNNGTSSLLAGPNVPSSLPIGTHTITAELTETGLPANVFTGQIRTWTLRIEPSVTVMLPASGANVTAIDGVTLTTSLVNPATVGGFNINPTPATSRGTKTDFCVTVDDFEGSAKVAATPGVTVTFTDNLSNAIGAPTAMTANTMCLDANAIAPTHKFDLAVNTTPEVREIRAVVVDNQTLNTLRNVVIGGAPPPRTRVEWPITVEPINSAPSISVHATSVQTAPNATPAQNANNFFKVTVADKDSNPALPASFQVTYQYQGITLDNGTNISGTNIPFGNDCFFAVSQGTDPTKYECNLAIPSYITTGSMAEQTVSVTAQVQDNDFLAVANTLVGGPGLLSSNTITWNLDVKEATTAPTFNNKVIAGAASTATDTYIYLNGVPATAISAVTEGQIIHFNVAVNEPDRDNYSVRVLYQQTDNTGTPTGTYVPFTATPAIPHAVTYASDVNPRVTSYQVTVPEDVISGAAARAGINFRIEVTEAPSVVAALPAVTTDFAMTVTNNNPAPTFSAGPTPAPALAATHNVLEGFPFTVDHGATIADTSTADGTNAVFQWQQNPTCVTANGNITGATTTSLQWTPDVNGGTYTNSNTACLRLCVGDDGFGNPADCSVLTAGPWVGGANDFITVREAEQPLATNVGTRSSAQWVTSDGTHVHRYVVDNSTGTADEIRVTQTRFNKTTGVYDEPLNQTLRSDTTANVLEVPRSFSITGDATHVWIAYLIDEVDFFAVATPVIRVRRLDRATLAVVDSIDINIVTSDLGHIVYDAASTDWYLPFVDFANGDSISVINMDVADVVFNNPADISFNTMATASSEVMNVIDPVNNNLVIAQKENVSGNFNLESFDVSGAIAVGASQGSQSNVFAGNAITPGKADLAGPQTGNDFIYIVGIYTGTTQMNIVRADGSNLANPTAAAPINVALTQLNSAAAIRIVAGSDGANHELFVATTNASNAYLTRVTNETTTKVAFNAAPNNGRLNKNVGQAISADGNELDVSFLPLQSIGSDGNSAGENTKDIILYNFHDGTAANTTGILINADDMPNLVGREPYFK